MSQSGDVILCTAAYFVAAVDLCKTLKNYAAHEYAKTKMFFFLLFGFLSYYYVRYKLLHFDENFFRFNLQKLSYKTLFDFFFCVYLIQTNVTNVPNRLALFSLQMYTAQILGLHN
jgi:signal transduction histidine kinase